MLIFYRSPKPGFPCPVGNGHTLCGACAASTPKFLDLFGVVWAHLEIFFIWDRKRARERLLTSATLAHPNHQQSTVNHQPFSVTFGNLRKPTVTYGRRFLFPDLEGNASSLPFCRCLKPQMNRTRTDNQPFENRYHYRLFALIIAHYRLIAPFDEISANPTAPHLHTLRSVG